MTSLLIRRAEVEGRAGVDCRLRGQVVVAVGSRIERQIGEEVLDAAGGALLPGLADHHVHLLALAAARTSVDITAAASPADVRASLSLAAQAAPAGDWVRAIGYDEVAHGPLDRRVLDQWVPGTPVRVQHRSGALWIVNSAAARLLDLDETDRPGLERDSQGRTTGRLWRADGWLRDSLGGGQPELAPVGAVLASYGVTHVTDATPDDTGWVAATLAEAVRTGALPQRVRVMGSPSAQHEDCLVSLGPRKIVVSDHDLPSLADLIDWIRAARSERRAVAVHCVTREALVLTTAALECVGAVPGDRVEHAAVAADETVWSLSRLQVRVVTQPTLVARRGDDYLARVDPRDTSDLWRYRSLLDAGIRVAPSSDAPYGDPDPWATLRAARDRRAPSGRVVGPAERVSTEQALRGLLSSLDDPGGAPRRVVPGARADVVLLDRPLAAALREPDTSAVRATLVAGKVIYRR